jgi:hypothetical protein
MVGDDYKRSVFYIPGVFPPVYFQIFKNAKKEIGNAQNNLLTKKIHSAMNPAFGHKPDLSIFQAPRAGA